ncbi:DUF7344 domain-containing protein [Halovivax cerinus]|uniref:DUF7344 domain-containing protein n=1 Tax=Halovivax cerinus TaxID=1487865 RepID=A0ABD5NL48_9EURY|nr:hypothetical protein [Halovivax cerinus]
MIVESDAATSRSVVDATGQSDLLAALSNPRRGTILWVLSDADDPVDELELTRNVAAHESRTSPERVTAQEERTVGTSLRHSHLPALASRSLVEWDRADERVALADDVATTQVRTRLQSVPPTGYARHLRTLSHPRRRLVVDVFAREGSPLSVPQLCRRIAAREVDPSGSAPSASTVDRIRISLVHSHLPALSTAGIVTYDDTSGTVAPSDALVG